MDKKKLLDWLDEWLDIVCLAVASLALLLALMPSNAMGEAGATTDASGSQEPVEKVIETDDSANQDDSSSSAAVAPVVDDLSGSARTDASASVVEPASTAAASAAPTPDEATQPDAEPIEAAPAETAPVTIENPVATIGSTQYASFDEAVAAAKTGDTILLLSDATTSGATITTSLTIDLGSHALSGAGLTIVGSSIVIRDGSVSLSSAAHGASAAVELTSGASLKLEGTAMTLSGASMGLEAESGTEVSLSSSSLTASGLSSTGVSADALSSSASTITACDNGGSGIVTSGSLDVTDGSTASVSGNACSAGLLAPSAAVVVGGSSTVDGSSTLSVTGNDGSGVYVQRGASLDLESGVIQHNVSRLLGRGGGIANYGSLTVGSGVTVNNNTASVSGDDIYSSDSATLELDADASGTLDACGDEIDGWYDDSALSRWAAHAEASDHIEAVVSTDFSLEVSLKAAHGGTLAVSKAVINSSLELDTTVFSFTIKLDDGSFTGDCRAVLASISSTPIRTETVTFSNGEATIQLSDAQMLFVHGLPCTGYTVTEQDAPGYHQVLPKDDSGTPVAATGTIHGIGIAHADFTNEPDSASGPSVSIEKVVKGDTPASYPTFSVRVTPVLFAPMPEGTADGSPLTLNLDVAADGDGSVSGSTTFSLATASFSRAGTYRYVIREVDDHESGWTYDDAAFAVTVTVEKDAESGAYVVTGTSIVGDDGTAVSQVTFTNTFTAPHTSSDGVTPVDKTTMTPASAARASVSTLGSMARTAGSYASRLLPRTGEQRAAYGAVTGVAVAVLLASRLLKRRGGE